MNYLSGSGGASEEKVRHYRHIPILDSIPGSHTIRTVFGIYDKMTLNNAASLLAHGDTPNTAIKFSSSAAADASKYALPG